MKNRRRNVRPRIQRAFFRWWVENQGRFAVPLRIGKRTDRFIKLGFAGVNPSLTVVLTLEIGVYLEWQGEWWDILSCFEAAPRHTPEGHVCDLYLTDARGIYPSREAQWREQLFEPFLEWVNAELASALWIGIFQTGNGGARWAELTSDRQPGIVAEAWLPVCVEHAPEMGGSVPDSRKIPLTEDFLS